MSKYEELLNVFAQYDNITELMKEVLYEDALEREAVYLQIGKYPEKRDLFGKFIMDISVMQEAHLRGGDKC